MESRYLDPKTDITFKRIFGLQKNADITMGFLNAVLKLDAKNAITKVTIQDPSNHPELAEKRRSIVDVRCTDKKQNQYIIEMQIIDQKNFAERCQYYVGKAIADQLDVKQNFKKLKPVIFIGVLDKFTIDPDDHFLCHHNLRNVQTNKCVLSHIDFYFLELKKFNLTAQQLVTPIDHWAFMLNKAAELSDLPVQLQEDQPVKRAFEQLDRVGWTQADLDAYRLSLEILYEDENAKENWLEAGREEGAQKALLATARKMLAIKMSLEDISEVTGLSLDAIIRLRS